MSNVENLERINELEILNRIIIEGKQHGFKNNQRNATVGLQLQDLIARALDEMKDNFR